MAIDAEYIKQQASYLADYEIHRALYRTQRNQKNFKAQLDGINALEKALRDLSTAVKGMKSAEGGMLVNSATFSHADYATAKVEANATPGSYQFFVQQLASKHQLAINGLGNGAIDTQGTLTLGQGAESFDIDLSQLDTQADGTISQETLAAAINAAADNTGIKATLVRSGGEVSLILTSEKSGEDQAISLNTSGTSGGAFDDALNDARELSAARDAIVLLGGEGGMELRNSSNTFDNLIEGVSLTFSKAHASGETPLNLDIDQDNSATREKVQAFVNAVNTLLTSFDTLTASGGKDSTRGILAGDASTRSIEGALSSLLRGQYEGVNLMQFGIVADAKGKLTIDTKLFDKAVAADPQAFEKLFSGKDNLFDSLEHKLNAYTSSTNGLMKGRKDSLDAQLRRADDELVKIETQHEMFYNRYLKQYTNMARVIAQMEATYGLF